MSLFFWIELRPRLSRDLIGEKCCIAIRPRALNVATCHCPERRIKTPGRIYNSAYSDNAMCGIGCITVTSVAVCTHHARSWTDFQITSHLLFVLAIMLSVCRQFYELVFMTSTVIFFSVWYHKNREEFGVISCIDSFCAKAFYVYALVQMSRSPSSVIFCVDAIFALVTGMCFIATHLNNDPALYAWIHPLGLHVCPGIWTLFVVATHEPIILNGSLRAITNRPANLSNHKSTCGREKGGMCE